jgi:hypothetical protein
VGHEAELVVDRDADASLAEVEGEGSGVGRHWHQRSNRKLGKRNEPGDWEIGSSEG